MSKQDDPSLEAETVEVGDLTGPTPSEEEDTEAHARRHRLPAEAGSAEEDTEAHKLRGR